MLYPILAIHMGAREEKSLTSQGIVARERSSDNKISRGHVCGRTLGP